MDGKERIRKAGAEGLLKTATIQNVGNYSRTIYKIEIICSWRTVHFNFSFVSAVLRMIV